MPVQKKVLPFHYKGSTFTSRRYNLYTAKVVPLCSKGTTFFIDNLQGKMLYFNYDFWEEFLFYYFTKFF